jgi:hypothetical protein
VKSREFCAKPCFLQAWKVCAYNINRKQKDLKLFEFGKIYFKAGEKYIEEERLALYITGNVETENWQHQNSACNIPRPGTTGNTGHSKIGHRNYKAGSRNRSTVRIRALTTFIMVLKLLASSEK